MLTTAQSHTSDLRAREERLRLGLERQLDLSRRLREYAFHLRAALRTDALRDPRAVFAEVAQVSAAALDVARVSVWRLDVARGVLACQHLFVRGEGAQVATELSIVGLERYVRALTTDLLAVDDITTDPRLLELRRYCAERRIGALLDIPIVVEGEVLGVLCHEHLDGARIWDDAEVDFAASLGGVVALAMEAERRHQAQEARTRLEAELAEQQRFESLGRMAASVAHDFNNVLTVLSLSLAHGGKGGAIAAAMTYGRELVASLLSYARREPVAAQDVEVDRAVGELVPVLATAIGKELQLDVVLRAAGRYVRIAPAELHQLVANLVTNAGEATRGHGSRVAIATAVCGGAIELVVTDDGRGMDEATRARAFDPFFTTKRASEGSGIGLATCQSIVVRAGGAISVASEVGVGTELRVRLPLSDAAAHPETAEAAPGERAPAAGAVAAASAWAGEPAAGLAPAARAAQVLLVEGSSAIGSLMDSVLREAGHEVARARSIPEALAAIERTAFGAIVCELPLADGRGDTLLAAARARDAATAIVIVSGDAAAPAEVDALVRKPFTSADLREGLARAQAARSAIAAPVVEATPGAVT